MKHQNRFSQFIKEYRIISISVAFITGMVAFNLVQSLVNDIILPIMKPILSNQSTVWEDLVLHIGTINIRIGSFLSAAISFLLVILFLYIFVDKILKWKPKKQ